MFHTKLLAMKTKKLITILLTFLLLGFISTQNDDNMSFDEVEKIQDNIEDMYVDIYRIIDKYPAVTYTYVYDNGQATAVNIEGIPENYDKKRLEVYLLDLDNMKHKLADISNRVGIYYMAETEPKPKMGYREFYENLYKSLTYPESATDNGVEGTVFVKFVVEDDGEVDHIIASEDIEAPGEWIVKDMKQEAKKAVKETSGNWEPAKIGGIPVAQWVVLPVQFKIKERPFSRSL